MKTTFNPSDRLTLARRIDHLTTESVPLWGKMSCTKMLAHLADSARMALGELPVQAKRGPLRFGPLRYAIIYWLPFPKGVPTAPELLERQPQDRAVEASELKQLLERLAARADVSDWPEHPAFGRLSARDWGVLTHRHVDHHLRQFGV